MATPKHPSRSMHSTPGMQQQYGITPGPYGQPSLSYTQQKSNLHLRENQPSEPRGSHSTKPMLEKALAFRLKQHPSTRA